MKNVRKLISAALISLFAFSTVGCNMIEKTPEAINKSVVAQVNDEKITRGELDANPMLTQNLLQIKAKYGENYESNAEAKEAVTQVKQQVLDEMVTEKVIAQQAKKLNIGTDSAALDKDVTKEYDDIKKSFGDDKKFEEALKQQGLTEKTLKEMLKNKVLADKIGDEITKDIKIDDAKAKKYYEENIVQFKVTPDTVHPAHILVKTEEEAKKVKERLDKGEDFAKVAKEVSTDTGSKDNGGDLPETDYINPKYISEFMKATETMKDGEISTPVKSSYGYHIIKVIKKTTNPAKDFNSVKEQIKADLLKEEKSKTFSEKLEQWKKDSKIETKKYEKNLI